VLMPVTLDTASLRANDAVPALLRGWSECRGDVRPWLRRRKVAQLAGDAGGAADAR